jgi:hypothetical protein
MGLGQVFFMKKTIIIFTLLSLGSVHGIARAINYCDSLRLYTLQLTREDQFGSILSTTTYGMFKSCDRSFQWDSINGFLLGYNATTDIAVISPTQTVYFVRDMGNDSLSTRMIGAVIRQLVQQSSTGSVSELLEKLFTICRGNPVLYLSNDEELHLSLEQIKTPLGGDEDQDLRLVQFFDLSGKLVLSSYYLEDALSLPHGIYLRVYSFGDGRQESKKIIL